MVGQSSATEDNERLSEICGADFGLNLTCSMWLPMRSLWSSSGKCDGVLERNPPLPTYLESVKVAFIEPPADRPLVNSKTFRYFGGCQDDFVGKKMFWSERQEALYHEVAPLPLIEISTGSSLISEYSWIEGSVLDLNRSHVAVSTTSLPNRGDSSLQHRKGFPSGPRLSITQKKQLGHDCSFAICKLLTTPDVKGQKAAGTANHGDSEDQEFGGRENVAKLFDVLLSGDQPRRPVMWVGGFSCN